MSDRCQDSHGFVANDPHLIENERKTFWVTVITFVMMVVEIVGGQLTGSMALLADGWHMASHAGAMGISLFAYRLSRSQEMSRHFSFGAGKLIPLGGYTSALLLLLIAGWMAVESTTRLIHPVSIHFGEAIWVAAIGLGVNIVCAWILRESPHVHGHENGHHHEQGKGHDHDHDPAPHEPEIHDHNLRSAYVHVLADAVTSILAIAALVIGRWKGWLWCDAIVGVGGGIVILKWSIGLLRETGWELLDGHSKAIDPVRMHQLIEAQGGQIVDFHVWRVAPKAVACELVIRSTSAKGTQFYRELVRNEFGIQHIVIEERVD